MIQFTYQLEGAGWAEATISDGRVGESIPASYICDALGDFVAAVQSLFTTDSAECVWELEPGEIKWNFKRQGQRATIEVFLFNEVRVAPDRFKWQMVLDRIAFSGECDLLDLAVQVERELQRTLDQWGLEGYEREWDHPFPKAAQQRLQEHIKAERGRRRVAREPSI